MRGKFSDNALEGRKARVQMAQKIAEAMNGCTLKKLRAIIQLNIGVDGEKADEYIEVLKDAEIIEFKDGKLVYDIVGMLPDSKKAQ